VNSRALWSGATGDVVFLAGFVAFFGLPFLTYVLLVWTGVLKLPASKVSGSGQRMLRPVFVGYYYWLLGPVFRLVERTALRPNHVTLGSMGMSALTAAAIATGHFALASALLISGATLDIIDGHLARTKRMTTASGAFLDSTVDRICDGLIFGGCVVYYAGTPMMYVSLLVMIGSFTVSYARARGETLGIVGAEGLMQRAERLTILGISLAFAPLFGHRLEGFVPHPVYGVTAAALCLLATLNTTTLIARVRWTMVRLDQGPYPNLVRPRTERPLSELRASKDDSPMLNHHA
jgi:phosphatidylglycerophosphate synthase